MDHNFNLNSNKIHQLNQPTNYSDITQTNQTNQTNQANQENQENQANIIIINKGIEEIIIKHINLKQKINDFVNKY